MIRSGKKSIFISIGDQSVTFNELQTVLFESAYLINERPMGKTPTSMEDESHLHPNDLLLVRSLAKVPTGNFDTTISSKRRLYFVQRLIDAFFTSLLTRRKWHHQKINVSVNDTVIIKD